MATSKTDSVIGLLGGDAPKVGEPSSKPPKEDSASLFSRGLSMMERAAETATGSMATKYAEALAAVEEIMSGEMESEF